MANEQEWRKLPLLRNDHLIFIDTSAKPRPGEILPCLICTKPMLIRPYTGTPDQICSQCWRTYADCAVVVCNICQVTIARLAPHITESGFYVRPRGVLHVTSCNVCAPGKNDSTILEIEAWNKALRPRSTIVKLG